MSMVHLVQLLCPNHHCIIAGAYHSGATTFDATVEQMRRGMDKTGIEYRCGLCGSRKLSFVDGKTRWSTMEEALPHLQAEEAKQLISRALLDATLDRSRN